MDTNKIKNLIGYKQDRIILLNEKKQKLTDFKSEITVSKLKRSFQSAYYNIKRFLLVIGLIILFLTALLTIVYPDALFVNSESYKNTVVTNFRDEFQAITNQSLEISLQELQNNSSYNLDALELNIDQSLENTATTNVKGNIRMLSIALLLLCFGIWYIIRLTKRVKERSELLAKIAILNQEIINDYGLSIEEEEREIKELQNTLNSSN